MPLDIGLEVLYTLVTRHFDLPKFWEGEKFHFGVHVGGALSFGAPKRLPLEGHEGFFETFPCQAAVGQIASMTLYLLRRVRVGGKEHQAKGLLQVLEERGSRGSVFVVPNNLLFSCSAKTEGEAARLLRVVGLAGGRVFEDPAQVRVHGSSVLRLHWPRWKTIVSSREVSRKREIRHLRRGQQVCKGILLWVSGNCPESGVWLRLGDDSRLDRDTRLGNNRSRWGSRSLKRCRVYLHLNSSGSRRLSCRRSRSKSLSLGDRGRSTWHSLLLRCTSRGRILLLLLLHRGGGVGVCSEWSGRISCLRGSGGDSSTGIWIGGWIRVWVGHDGKDLIPFCQKKKLLFLSI